MKIKAEIVLVPSNERDGCSFEDVEIDETSLPITIFEGDVPEEFSDGKFKKSVSDLNNSIVESVEKIFADNFRGKCYCKHCRENHAKLVVEITHEENS